MSARAFNVTPGYLVSSVNDRSAVLVSSGVMALGLTVAEARRMSLELGQAADAVEYNLALRERMKNERQDEPRHSRWDEVASLESGKPLTGEL